MAKKTKRSTRSQKSKEKPPAFAVIRKQLSANLDETLRSIYARTCEGPHESRLALTDAAGRSLEAISGQLSFIFKIFWEAVSTHHGVGHKVHGEGVQSWTLANTLGASNAWQDMTNGGMAVTGIVQRSRVWVNAGEQLITAGEWFHLRVAANGLRGAYSQDPALRIEVELPSTSPPQLSATGTPKEAVSGWRIEALIAAVHKVLPGWSKKSFSRLRKKAGIATPPKGGRGPKYEFQRSDLLKMIDAAPRAVQNGSKVAAALRALL